MRQKAKPCGRSRLSINDHCPIVVGSQDQRPAALSYLEEVPGMKMRWEWTCLGEVSRRWLKKCRKASVMTDVGKEAVADTHRGIESSSIFWPRIRTASQRYRKFSNWSTVPLVHLDQSSMTRYLFIFLALIHTSAFSYAFGSKKIHVLLDVRVQIKN